VLLAVAFMVLPRLFLQDAQSVSVLDEIGELYVATAWWVFALVTWIGSAPERATGRLIVSDAPDVSGTVRARQRR
jgi:hypothetical protein